MGKRLFNRVLLLSVFVFVLICGAKSDEDIPDAVGETLNEEERRLLEPTKVKHEYTAEIQRLLKIIINSLYQNKNVFLRELVANAQDALNKAYIESLKNTSYLGEYKELAVWIKYEAAKKIVTIRDSGIGMTKEELIKNLGTIAKSGTEEFTSKLKASEGPTPDQLNAIVGKFGVGFYSAFLVADNVTVISKHNNDRQYVWESNSDGFSVAEDPRGNTLGRGTAVILHLKSSAEGYANYEKLHSLIVKHTMFLSHNIYLAKETGSPVVETPASSSEEDKVEDEVSTQTPGNDKDGVGLTYNYTLVNTDKPLWLKDPSEVKEQEYLEFYRSIVGNTYEKYGLKVHFSAEGNVNLRALLFIPQHAHFNIFSDKSSDNVKNDRVKLYSKRVYVTPALKTIFADYLYSVVGIIESDDIPLNVARENIQHQQIMRVISKKVTRKIISAMESIPAENYSDFYANHNAALKMGVMTDLSNRNRLFKLLRFYSSQSVSSQNVSLDDYIGRMKENQKQILYVVCDKLSICENFPLAKLLVKRKFEVLYFTASLDESVVRGAPKYRDYFFQNVAVDGVDFGEDNSTDTLLKETLQKFNSLINFWTSSSSYKSRISGANISLGMEEACLLVAPEHGISGTMEKIVLNIYGGKKGPQADEMKRMLKAPKYLYFNPFHPLSEALLRLVDDGETEKNPQLKHLAKTCYSIAQLNGGFSLNNLQKIATVLEDNVLLSLNLEPLEERKKIKKLIKEATGDHSQQQHTDESSPIDPESKTTTGELPQEEVRTEL